MANVLVTIYNSSGAPKVDATPTFVAVRSTSGTLLANPTIVNAGNGNYTFELNGNCGYLIATHATPSYVAGGVGDGVWFALYDGADTPKADATPAVNVWGWNGSLLATPSVTNAGSGLYWFTSVTGIFKVTSGCFPPYLDGSIDAVTPTPVYPSTEPTSTTSANVKHFLMQYKVNLASGLPVLTNHRLTRIYDAEAVAQALWFRLSRLRGEWDWDLESGLPWLDWMESPKPNMSAIRQTIAAEVMKVKGVSSIASLNLVFNPTQSSLSIGLRVVAGGSVVEVTI